MIRTFVAAAGLLVGLVSLSAQAPTVDRERNWPMWRGPHANGIATHADPPLEWSETKNVKWKVEIPGRGSSSPIVWGDRIYVTTAVPVGLTGDAQHAPRGQARPRLPHKFVVMALDRKTGKTVWEQVAREQEPHEAGHADNSTWASPSPFTDGERVFAYFESFGLFAYDLSGTLPLQKDLGDKRMRNEFTRGRTPALHGNHRRGRDHLNGESFIVALDKRDGHELWRVARDEIDTWATPLIVDVNGRAQVVVPALKRIRAYDLENGSVVWDGDGLTMNAIPSPVYDDGIAYLMSGFQGNDLRAVRLADAKGNIDGTSAVAWSFDRDTPYVPSPILVNGILYFLKTNQACFRVRREDGETAQNQRLEGLPSRVAGRGAGPHLFPGRDGSAVGRPGRPMRSGHQHARRLRRVAGRSTRRYFAWAQVSVRDWEVRHVVRKLDWS
jgi:outer membrane protein assembly factor BamB